MQRSPNLRFFALECILYDIRLCQLMAFRAYFLHVIFDGCFAWPQDVANRCGDSHWRAVNNHGKKAAKLDETGLETAGQNEIYIVINVLGLKIYSCIWKRCICVLIESVIYTIMKVAGMAWPSGQWTCSRENCIAMQTLYIRKKWYQPVSILGRYSLQILEVGWKSWGIRKLRYETSLVSNACKSSQLDMPGINYNAYTCVVS